MNEIRFQLVNADETPLIMLLAPAASCGQRVAARGATGNASESWTQRRCRWAASKDAVRSSKRSYAAAISSAIERGRAPFMLCARVTWRR